MGTSIQLDNLNDIISRIREQGEKDAEQWAKNAREQAEQSVKDAEQTRLAILLLGSVGIEPTHIYDTSVRIVLGFFPSTLKGNRALATTIRRFREALGCRITVEGKDVHDARKKQIRFILRAEDFPTLQITFLRRLPRGAKCRIVKQSTSWNRLVCEL
jgi:hypothetical protein